jgi:hypothetical protein
VIAGLVLTIMLAMRRRPGLELEVHGRELVLRKTGGAMLASAPVGMIGVTRGIHAYSGRGGEYQQIALVLRLGQEQPVSIGILDTRYAWSDSVPRVRAPRWLVGPPDWNALVDLLGLGGFLVVKSDGWT